MAPSGAVEVPDPHAREPDDVAQRVGLDRQRGLAASEAERRRRAHGPNEIATADRVGWRQRIAEQFRDPLVILLLFAIAVSTAAWALEGRDGVPVDALAIAAIVMLNAAIGAVQSNRADAAAAALQRMAATKATVIRDGEEMVIDTRDVVVGDLLLVLAGNAVAADGRVLEESGLLVAEAALTGESVAVAKGSRPVASAAALGDRSSMVFAGTLAVAGHARVAVVATGMQTQVGGIASLLDTTERATTPLEREIASVGRLLGSLVVGVAAVVIATLLVVSDLESSADVVDILLVGVSLAVAAVPEGLPAVLSVVLAIGVQRMAGRNALVKRLASAETLGAATTICTDKTGTLTRGEMSVAVVMAGNARAEVTGIGYKPEGDFLVDGRPPDASERSMIQTLLDAGVAASHARVELVDGHWRARGNPTEAAIVVAAQKANLDVDEIAGRRRIDEEPFTSDRKRMSVLVETAGGAAPTLLVKGAPDVLLTRSERELTATGPVPMSVARHAWWSDRIEELASAGMRVLAVARRDAVTAPIDDIDETDLDWLGLLGILDPPREEALESVDAAQRSGIRVLMITGDHPKTARAIASQLGITDMSARVVTGDEIDSLDQRGLVAVSREASVFARVAPAHKLRLVKALQESGEVVAMTGDGVNDAPALKAADIGTSMGVAGTDVAREASDMILLDDNFATMVVAVGEGRTIFHNVRSFLRYLISSNVGEVLTVFFGIVLAGVIGLDGDGVLAPLTATQILWINLLTDTGPALALGLDPMDRRLMREPPRSVTSRVIDRRMKGSILLVGATMAVVTLLMFDLQLPGGLIEGDESIEKARTAAFTVLVLAQLFNCFSARSDVVSAARGWMKNSYLLAAVILALLLQVAVVHLPLLNDAFATVPLSIAEWLLSAVLASAVLWVSELQKLVRRSVASRAAVAVTAG